MNRFIENPTSEAIPKANPNGLKGAHLYYDCVNHFPERFTLAFLKSAVKHGAKIANYTKMEEFILEENESGAKVIKGIQVTDLIHQKKHNLRANLVINCAVPWADLVGSEGVYGIVVALTWKIYHHQPKNRQYMSFIFPNWESAVDASRAVSQGEFGMPAVFRISDAAETQFGLKMYGIEGGIFDKLMNLRGYKPEERCLCIATADGAKQFAKNIKKQTKKICRKHGAMYLGGSPAKQWEHG